MFYSYKITFITAALVTLLSACQSSSTNLSLDKMDTNDVALECLDCEVELDNLTMTTDYSTGQTLYPIKRLPIFLDQLGSKPAGTLAPASEVTVVDEKPNFIQIQISGWRKAKGFGRVIQEEFGMNIPVGILTKEAALSQEVIVRGERKIDDLTGLPWEQVKIKAWAKKELMLNEITPLWANASQTYRDNCSMCHTQPEVSHFDANTWPGLYDGMKAFVNFDKDTEALVLKYLQKHSSDFNEVDH